MVRAICSLLRYCGRRVSGISEVKVSDRLRSGVVGTGFFPFKKKDIFFRNCIVPYQQRARHLQKSKGAFLAGWARTLYTTLERLLLFFFSVGADKEKGHPLFYDTIKKYCLEYILKLHLFLFLFLRFFGKSFLFKNKIKKRRIYFLSFFNSRKYH